MSAKTAAIDPNPAPPKAFASVGPLGALCTPGATEFRVVAEADAVRVRLRHPGTLQTRIVTLSPEDPAEREAAQVWRTKVEGDWLHWAYEYEIDRNSHTISGIVDPWARLVRGDRGYIHRDDIRVTPRPPLSPQDAIIYELHTRDFTRDAASGAKPAWRGKYPGLAQSGTRLAGTELTTGLDHILELGVNTVQIMPVHAFAMPYDPDYEWGYMPLYFNAPSEAYAAGVELDAPIREFKALVSALHERGLRVTLDVVYNHTFEKWPDRFRSLMALAPNEYFRFKDNNEPWNGSLCGNEFRSESRFGRQFIIDSVKFWVTEYGIDGYRFDLMGLIDQETMTMLVEELHRIDPTLLIYGEPWSAGPTPIEINNKGKQRSRGWGVFNDDIRDGLRGEVFRPEEAGFLTAGTNGHRVKIGILGGVGSDPLPTRVAPPIASFADQPTETINYIECHDNHTLADRLKLTTRHDHSITNDARDKMNRMGVLALMTSQGIPFLHAGQEFGRTKAGEDNTYNLGDAINNVPWHQKEANTGLFSFYRDAVRLRRDHPMFRLATRAEVVGSVQFFDDDLGLHMPSSTLAWMVTDPTGQDSWHRAVVILNAGRSAVSVPLPEGSWLIWTTDGRFERRRDAAARAAVRGTHTLQAHCGAVLYSPR